MQQPPSPLTLLDYLIEETKLSKRSIRSAFPDQPTIAISNDGLAPPLLYWKGKVVINASLESCRDLSKIVNILSAACRDQSTGGAAEVAKAVNAFSETLKAIDVIFPEPNRKKILLQKLAECVDGTVAFVVNRVCDPHALVVFTSIQEILNVHLGQNEQFH